MMKVHSTVLLFWGMSTLLLGQSQGCNVVAMFYMLTPGGIVDGNSHPEDPSNDDLQGQLDQSGRGKELILVAQLSGLGGLHGKAEYRQRDGRFRLKVELEDAAPASTRDIVVNGAAISQLTIGALGEAEVEFDTKVQPGHLPWPMQFPNGLTQGAAIAVGSATGVLGSV